MKNYSYERDSKRYNGKWGRAFKRQSNVNLGSIYVALNSVLDYSLLMYAVEIISIMHL